MKIPENLMHASFFFIDIVGLSDPLLSTTTQAKKIRILNDFIADCKTYKETPETEKFVFPTGDGMWISFLSGIEKPVQLSFEIHKKLQIYNKEKTANENFHVRIGCHSGDVFFVNDLNDNLNLWGSGIIMARRVMDAGDANHILMTSAMAESLFELSDEYKKIIHPIHDFKIKHGEIMLVYSVYDDQIGNSDIPEKGIIASKQEKKITEEINPIRYNQLMFVVAIKDLKKKIVKITRTFSFENISDEPVYEIYDVIKIDTPKSFTDLNVEAFDENETKLDLSSIHLDTKNKKEFSIKLKNPVFRGNNNKKITISYKTELLENIYEEIFKIPIDNFAGKMIFPSNEKELNPKLFLSTEKTREKNLQEKIDTKRGITTQINWAHIEGIKEKDLIRFEW